MRVIGLNVVSSLATTSLAGLVFALCCCSTVDAAAVATFQQGGAFSDTDATYIQGSNGEEDTNFVNTVNLLVEDEPGVGVFRTLVRFADIFGSGVGQVPAGSIINSATLTLRTNGNSFDGTADTLSVFRTTSNWDESTVTWNSFNAGGVAGVDYDAAVLDTFVPLNPSTNYDIDITAAAQIWSGNTALNQGIIVIGSGFDRVSFRSDDIASSQPLLTIDYSVIPEPASGTLAGIGLVLLAVRRRSTRRHRVVAGK